MTSAIRDNYFFTWNQIKMCRVDNDNENGRVKCKTKVLNIDMLLSCNVM